MTASSERSIAKEVNTWVQTTGILIASLWGVYTFIYKEITLPRAAPINVTVDVQLKKISPPDSQLQQGEKKALIAVEMAVSATNPSFRTVYLFPSMWVAYGAKVSALRENEDFAKQVTVCLNGQGIGEVGQYASIYDISPAPVAIGRLFPDDSLKPNEKVTRKVVFYVPTGHYDSLEVHAVVPTLARKEGAVWEWKYNEKTGSIDPIIYRVAKDGKRTEMEKNRNGAYSDAKLELQTAESISTLSLWQ